MLEQYPELLKMRYDPDGDQFNFGVIEAFKVSKRMAFFAFIRRQLFANDAKGFTQGAEYMHKAHEELKEKHVCPGWETPKYDLALLMAVSDKGVSYLRSLKYQGDDYGLTGVKMNKKKLLKRAEWLCATFKKYFVI